MLKEDPLKGTYCLLIHLKQNSKITVGKLGEINFQKGYYIYVGSALNSLKTRIQRHLRDEKKIHWHIDYLLISENAEIIDVFYTISDFRWECKIAANIAETGTGVVNFGCSDCKCDFHLFFFRELRDSRKICINTLEKYDLEVYTF
jgi:Uri superfamily endonuclease